MHAHMRTHDVISNDVQQFIDFFQIICLECNVIPIIMSLLLAIPCSSSFIGRERIGGMTGTQDGKYLRNTLFLLQFTLRYNYYGSDDSCDN